MITNETTKAKIALSCSPIAPCQALGVLGVSAALRVYHAVACHCCLLRAAVATHGSQPAQLLVGLMAAQAGLGPARVASIAAKLDAGLGLDVQDYVDVLAAAGDEAALQLLNAGAAAPRVVVPAQATVVTKLGLTERYLIASARRGLMVLLSKLLLVRSCQYSCIGFAHMLQLLDEVPLRLPASPCRSLRACCPAAFSNQPTAHIPLPALWQEAKKRRSPNLPANVRYGKGSCGRVGFSFSELLPLMGKCAAALTRLLDGQQTHKASHDD